MSAWTFQLKDWLTAGLIAIAGACGQQADPPEVSNIQILADAGSECTEEVRIYADEAFYHRRDEPEQLFAGQLKRDEVNQGPGTRRHAYRLVTDHRELPIYATREADERLRPFVDRQAQVKGKLIDLRDEGFGIELWIKSITPQDP